MAVVRVQTKSVAQQLSTSSALTFTSNPTNGNALVMVIGIDSNTVTVSSIVQTGATWALIHRFPDPNGVAAAIEIWVALNVSGATGAATVTLSGSIRNALIACEYSGVVKTSVLDLSHDNAVATGGGNADTGLTGTTNFPNEVWVCGMQLRGTGAIGSTFPSLLTPNNSFAIVDQQFANSGTSVVAYRDTGYLERIVSTKGTAGSSCTLTGGASAAVSSTNTVVALIGVTDGSAKPSKSAPIANNQIELLQPVISSRPVPRSMPSAVPRSMNGGQIQGLEMFDYSPSVRPMARTMALLTLPLRMMTAVVEDPYEPHEV